MMDVVYILKDKPSPSGDIELRYSIRSLRHFPVKDLWIVTGNKRDWLDCNWVKQSDGINRWENGRIKVSAACNAPVSDPFLLMHDDMFFTKDTEVIPHHYDGEIKVGGTHVYARYQQESKKYSRDGLNYSIHTPLVVYKDVWLSKTRQGASSRNIYCSWSDHPKKQIKDVKLRTKKDHKNFSPDRFFSLSDYSWGMVGKQVSQMHPEKSKWEN